MTPTKAPGTAKESFTACLLPKGAACEKVRGISHLFEHIMISKLIHGCNASTAAGHTTEDYIILFCNGITPEEIMETLFRMRFTGDEVARHKRILIKEIEMESTNDEEAFFRFVWLGSDYEKSPLGTVSDAASITPSMLEKTRLELLEKSLFFYGSETGVEIFNGNPQVPLHTPASTITWLRNKTFRERHYDICYVNRRVEAYYLLTRILKDLNPDKHIQLSEKKDMSAFILETGTRFPTGRNISPLREKALKQIESDLYGIRSNTDERALNELESIYFYGKRWQERIGELFKTTDRELSKLLMECCLERG